MALTLIAVVLSLILGHIMPGIAHIRGYHWFISWLQALSRVLGGQSVWQGRFGGFTRDPAQAGPAIPASAESGAKKEPRA